MHSLSSRRAAACSKALSHPRPRRRRPREGDCEAPARGGWARKIEPFIALAPTQGEESHDVATLSRSTNVLARRGGRRGRITWPAAPRSDARRQRHRTREWRTAPQALRRVV